MFIDPRGTDVTWGDCQLLCQLATKLHRGNVRTKGSHVYRASSILPTPTLSITVMLEASPLETPPPLALPPSTSMATPVQAPQCPLTGMALMSPRLTPVVRTCFPELRGLFSIQIFYGFVSFDIGSHFVAQATSKLMVTFLHHPPKQCDDTHL